jgi:multidrug efflux pump subunit AcrA (membrane-fusion protein)
MTGYVDRNKTCSLTLPDNTRINGKISGRLPEMNVQNQTVSYIVNANLPEPLPENLIASAVIIKSTKTGAVVIPKKALLGNETMNEFWVMKVVNDSTAIKVPVARGIETDNEVEITDPVFLPSDRLILTGNYGLPDTASIIIEK